MTGKTSTNVKQIHGRQMAYVKTATSARIRNGVSGELMDSHDEDNVLVRSLSADSTDTPSNTKRFFHLLEKRSG